MSEISHDRARGQAVEAALQRAAIATTSSWRSRSLDTEEEQLEYAIGALKQANTHALMLFDAYFAQHTTVDEGVEHLPESIRQLADSTDAARHLLSVLLQERRAARAKEVGSGLRRAEGSGQ